MWRKGKRARDRGESFDIDQRRADSRSRRRRMREAGIPRNKRCTLCFLLYLETGPGSVQGGLGPIFLKAVWLTAPLFHMGSLGAVKQFLPSSPAAE